MAQSKKQATSKKGTTYTNLGNGQFELSGSATGLVDTISPGNSYYMIYRGSTVPPEKRQFSNEGYNAHLQNLRTLKFQPKEPWYQPIKDYIKPKWNGFVDKLKLDKNGGQLNYNNNLLKYISGK